MNRRNHAVIVAMYTPQMEICFTKDPIKARRKNPDAPILWRLIGGKKRKDRFLHEKPTQTALREIREETGKTLTEGDLFFIKKIKYLNHDVYLFSAPVDTLTDIRPEPGKPKIKVKAFDLEYILHNLDRFHLKHVKYLGILGLIKLSKAS